MQSIKARTLMHHLVVYGLLLSLTLLYLVPLYWLIRSSLMDKNSIFLFPPALVPPTIEWKNYEYVFTKFPLFLYLRNTLFILVPVVLGVLVTSTLAAYGFARFRWVGKEVVFAVLLSTMMLPYITTLLPTFIIWSKLMLVNTYWPLTLPAWFGGGIFNIFLLRQFFRAIPRDYDEAALLDGAHYIQILWHILIPLSRPALITVGIFTTLGVWNDFLAPLIYLNDPEKFTLALGLTQFRGEYASEWGYLMAAATLMLLPVLALFFVAQKYFIEGITWSGIKG